jgi:putative heme-binding domain-containing protein
MVNILEGTNDQWFRPSDVCVAPDGSLFIADWYDPGVGGHQAGDQNRGRIFRVSPPNADYKIPVFSENTEGVLKALENPNLSIRYKAWNALHNMGEKAEADLLKVYENSTNPRFKARAFWLLAKGKNGAKYVAMGAKNANSDIRCAAVRAARQGCADVIETVKSLFGDDNAQVRRECAIALRHNKSPEMPELWLGLIVEYDGKDRWALEALGIGADGRWDDVLPLIAKIGKDVNVSQEAINDIYWRSRGEKSADLIGALAGDKTVPLQNRLRYFRAFDFIPSKNKSDVLLKIIKGSGKTQADLIPVALRHLDADYVKNNVEARTILQNAMKDLKGSEYLEFADRYTLPSENQRLLTMALKDDNAGNAVKVLLKNTEGGALFNTVITDKKRETDALKLFNAIRGVGSEGTLNQLKTAAFDKKRSLAFRKGAIEALGGSWGGEDVVLSLLKSGKVEKNMIPSAVQGVSKAWRRAIRVEAASYMGGVASVGKKVPAIPDLMNLKGSEEKGIALFKTYCASCHQVNGEGVDYGPKLSEIGSKLSQDGQFMAILYPDAGISFGYEGWDLKLKNGTILRGMVTSRTETDWVFKQPDGSQQSYRISDISTKKQIPNSLMPVGFHESMKEQELADLVAYLMTLKRK